MAHQVRVEQTALLEPMELMVVQVLMVRQEQTELMGLRVQMVRVEVRVLMELVELMVQVEVVVRPEQMVQAGLQGQVVRLEHQELMVHQVARVQMEHQEVAGLMEQVVLVVILVISGQ
jgi:hypothetical protein